MDSRCIRSMRPPSSLASLTNPVLCAIRQDAHPMPSFYNVHHDVLRQEKIRPLAQSNPFNIFAAQDLVSSLEDDSPGLLCRPVSIF